MTLRRLTEIRLNRNAGKVEAVMERVVRLDVQGLTTSAAWLSDSMLAGLGFYEEGRLALIDRNGKAFGFRGDLPPNPDHVPTAVLQHAYQGSLTVRPDLTSITVVTRHASYVEIYDHRGILKTRKSGPFKFDPTFGVDRVASGPVMSSGDSLRFGYVALAVTQSKIYALFSGRTRLMYPGEANMGEYIHVFNWSGEFERALHLTTPAIALAVDPTDNVLYTVCHLPKPVIVRYALEPSVVINNLAD